MSVRLFSHSVTYIRDRHSAHAGSAVAPPAICVDGADGPFPDFASDLDFVVLVLRSTRRYEEEDVLRVACGHSNHYGVRGKAAAAAHGAPLAASLLGGG